MSLKLQISLLQCFLTFCDCEKKQNRYSVSRNKAYTRSFYSAVCVLPRDSACNHRSSLASLSSSVTFDKSRSPNAIFPRPRCSERRAQIRVVCLRDNTCFVCKDPSLLFSCNNCLKNELEKDCLEMSLLFSRRSVNKQNGVARISTWIFRVNIVPFVERPRNRP